MKKLNDLKADRTQLIVRYNEIMAMDEMTDELRKEATEIGKDLDTLNKDITLTERQEQINAQTSAPVEEVDEVETRSIGEQFRDFLQNVEKGGPTEFRAEPILTSTDTGIIKKAVGAVDVLNSPGIQALKDMGVPVYTGLTGNFVLPYMNENTAEFVSEGGDASTADMSTTSITLAARRVSHSQGITYETLAQTNADVYETILRELVNGIGNAVADDFFDNVETDCAGSVHATTVAGLSYGDLLQFEASLGGKNTNMPAYVTTPSIKAYLKQKAVLGTDNGPVWMDNEVNGYPAYGLPHANASKVYFGDFSRGAIAEFGPINIVVDKFSRAKQGELVITAIGLYDTGFANPNAVVWSVDVSAAV